jgi:hypothetical protein
VEELQSEEARLDASIGYVMFQLVFFNWFGEYHVDHQLVSWGMEHWYVVGYLDFRE